jgi:hypothetical protein
MALLTWGGAMSDYKIVVAGVVVAERRGVSEAERDAAEAELCGLADLKASATHGALVWRYDEGGVPLRLVYASKHRAVPRGAPGVRPPVRG